MIVEGQIHGGVTQGLGMGLREAMVFDEQGLLVNPSFMDYAILRASEIPKIDVELVEEPSPYGPFGIRGVGEPPITPCAAAISIAIHDAIGIRIEELPVRSEKIWELLKKTS